MPRHLVPAVTIAAILIAPGAAAAADLNIWPPKWQGPDLNARSSDVTIESLELVHEGLELVE